MIRVKILTGPLAGRESDMPETVNPNQLLQVFVRDRVRWKIDYTNATPDEVFAWGGADVTGRIMLALLEGRLVRFADPAGPREWRASSENEVIPVANEIQNVVAISGYDISIGSDDEHGFVMNVTVPKNSVQ
jgi:hypothetical protein